MCVPIFMACLQPVALTIVLHEKEWKMDERGKTVPFSIVFLFLLRNQGFLEDSLWAYENLMSMQCVYFHKLYSTIICSLKITQKKAFICFNITHYRHADTFPLFTHTEWTLSYNYGFSQFFALLLQLMNFLQSHYNDGKVNGSRVDKKLMYTVHIGTFF